ncbi:unnamed protein product [Mesocestoides corti]|uniref:BTB domain-containing protein n=1 Tax=Mesocestoides corti TaxID=53468 RepID=A0A0R3U9M2_MESCO|nr:unnamed protein product [Mesocestoides corti]
MRGILLACRNTSIGYLKLTKLVSPQNATFPITYAAAMRIPYKRVYLAVGSGNQSNIGYHEAAAAPRLVCVLDGSASFDRHMELAVKSIYSEQPNGYMECAPFVRLRRLGKFSDVRIETKDRQVVAAHRVVLVSRFPHLEQAVTNCVGGSLKWRRYDRDIVEAVVVFAYTGSIEISMDNAVRLFLLASNLGSLTITSWCAEFLRPRVSRENVEQIWWVANATKSTHMMDICVPVIAAHFDTITTQVTFHSTTELDSLLSMLRDDRLVGVAGAAKLRTIVNWFEGKSTSNRDNVTAFVDDDDSRVATFKDLLGAVNISEITSDDFVEFCMSDCWINLQRQFRDLISNAWKEARRRGLVQDYLIAYTYSHSKVTLTTSNWKEIEKKIIARSAGGELPTADVNFRCTVPSRSDCAVVVLNDSIYLIGGRNERAGASRLVDRVDPFDGRVSSAPPMVQARYWFSAAATPAFNCQQLLVFGGYNGTTQMSSCEKFDPAGSGTLQWRRIRAQTYWIRASANPVSLCVPMACEEDKLPTREGYE